MSSIQRGCLLASFLVLCCTGCTIPTIQHPLVDPADARSFPELHGVFRAAQSPESDDRFLHVGPAGDNYPDGFVRFLEVQHPKDATSALRSMSCIGFAEQIGRYYVFHVPLPRKELKLEELTDFWEQAWNVDEVDGYFVFRLSPDSDGLELSSWNVEFAEEQIKSNKIAGNVTEVVQERKGPIDSKKKNITVTADTDEVRRFFQLHVDGKLFNKPERKYTRIK